jgi:2-oxoisovalerate dehydrogenase E1 component alpha subunit
MGVLLWRGFPLNSVMAQCLGNHEDLGKARQMPVVSLFNFGSRHRSLNAMAAFRVKGHAFPHNIKPIGYSNPQAAGVGYALKRDPERRGKACAVVYFGEVCQIALSSHLF